MSKRGRIVLAIAIAVVVLGGYVWLFGVQTFFAFWSRKAGRDVPIVNSYPVELKDLEISRAEGKTVSFKGVELEVPWTDIDETKSRVVGGWAVLAFQSGKSILLCVNSPKAFMNNLFRDNVAKPEVFTALYGRDVLQSDYTLTKAIFDTTPHQINLLTPSNRAAGLSSVLLIKAIMPPTTDWAIYDIKTKYFTGFQLGDPVRRPKKMCVELYGDSVDIEINFNQVQSASATSITQAEMNRIAQSAHTVSDARPTLAISPG